MIPPLDDLAWVEPHVERFESQWRKQGRPDIAEFMAAVIASSSFVVGRASQPQAESRRRQLLLELIAVDLEFGWRLAGAAGRSTGPKLETYVKRQPELGPLDSLPLALIAEEYRARKRFASPPSHGEYAARFLRHGAALAAALDRVDEEIIAEYGRDGPITCAPPREHVGATQIERPLSIKDFRLQRLIGAGGVCKVYAAIERGADQPAAVKVLKKRFHRDRLIVSRLLREVEISSRLDGLQVAPVRGAGRMPDGGYFLVMDLAAGSDLARLAARGSLALPRVAEIVARIAATVDAIHRCGVVHCDLKPANILLAADGAPLVSDFGMARLVDSSTELTQSPRNYFAGAPAFAAPEQFDPACGPIGPHTDVFGLGGILYYLLADQPPFAGLQVSELANRPRLPDFSVITRPHAEALSAVCRKCLQPDWRRRYSAASQVADDIAAALCGRPFHGLPAVLQS